MNPIKPVIGRKVLLALHARNYEYRSNAEICFRIKRGEGIRVVRNDHITYCNPGVSYLVVHFAMVSDHDARVFEVRNGVPPAELGAVIYRMGKS